MLAVAIGTQLATACMNTNVIHAKVNIWPSLLLIRGDYCEDDGWITAFIRLPAKYYVRDIDPSTVTLTVEMTGGCVPLSEHRIFWRKVFIAKFDRNAVIDLLCPMLEHMAPHEKQKVTLVVTGNLFDGKSFRGEDTIRVILWD
jgi:hypothetical protein